MAGQRSLRAQAWLLRGLEHLSRQARRGARRPDHLQVGERGEREAVFFLRQQGYVVVARRWRTGRLRGDLDLIAWEGDTLCFVEVKTRAERNPLDPAEAAVDDEKRRMLRKMAEAYLHGFPEAERAQVVVRFDVLAVYLRAEGAVTASTPAFDLLRAAFARRE